MRAITLYQPWATWIADGDKRYETRSWRTDYRGEILIHAGKFDKFLPINHDYPLGAVLAIATLAHIYPTEGVAVDEVERSRGDWSRDRFAWLFRNVRPLAEPVPCRGKQGLWTPDDDLMDRVYAAGLKERMS